MFTATVTSLKRFAVHDGPGIRTTVFLKGCPLHCVWCHNPEGISPKSALAYLEQKCRMCGKCVSVCPNGAHSVTDAGHSLNRDLCRACGICAENCYAEALILYGKRMTAEEVFATVLEDKIFYETSGGGLTVSGGEPLLQADFCAELLGMAKAEGIHTAVDTCGAVTEAALEKTLAVTDLYLYDVKHMDPVRHRELTGMENTLPLANLRRLAAEKKPVEIRIPLIPAHNDSAENLHRTGEFLGALGNITRVKVLPYHDFARSKYESLGLPDTMPRVHAPDDEALEAACEILRGYGLHALSAKEA